MQKPTLIIEGSLTKETVMTQWAAIQPQLAKGIYHYVDLGQVTHSDSAGLAFLLAIMREASEGPQPITFLRLPQQMLDIAKVNNVMAFLPIGDN